MTNFILNVSEPHLKPIRGTERSAAFDVKSSIKVSVEPGASVIIPTGLSWAAPAYVAVLLMERSSQTIRKISVRGLIDPDYLGEWSILLHNQGEFLYEVEVGDRIAQAIPMALYPIHFFDLNVDGKLIDIPIKQLLRNDGGLGSTGK